MPDPAAGGSMDFRDSDAEIAFREDVRAFIRAELPPSFGTRATEWGLVQWWK